MTPSLQSCAAIAAMALLAACNPAAEDAAPPAAPAHDMAAMPAGPGAAAGLAAQADAVATMLLIRGHTMAGDALYAAGEREMALPHLRHPQMELYSTELEPLRPYGAEAAAQAGDRLVALGEAGASALEVSQAVADTFTALDAAIGNVGATLEQRAESLAAVLAVASEEYGVSISDGAVTDAAEFQDAWGFVQAVRHAFDRWRTEFNAVDSSAAQAFSDRLSALEALHDTPVPHAMAPAPQIFADMTAAAQRALDPFAER